jgi:spore maturation protein CgeB
MRFDMRILLLTVGRINYDCDINFYEPLKKIFREVIYFNYYLEIQTREKSVVNDEIVALATDTKPDYVFFITYKDEIEIATLQRLAQIGTKVVAWFSDDHWRFDKYSRYIADHIYCSITTDQCALSKYKALNLKAVQSQWASNSAYYVKKSESCEFDVTFIGQKYGDRGDLIDYLQANDVPLQLFGKGFSEYLNFEDMVGIFSRSRINLNFSTGFDPTVKQIKGRVFEITMCGGFLLTEYAEGLETYFRIGVDLECFTSQEEALDKIKFYLGNEAARAKIARSGHETCNKNHTWEQRLSETFSQIEKFGQPVRFADRLKQLLRVRR